MRKYQINPYNKENAINKSSLETLTKSTRNLIWIVDVLLLANVHRLCITTSKRDIRFFCINAEILVEEFSICSMPNNAVCMEYFYDVI